ncbi:fasciclin domain-containing protein [Natronoflexus pectinivorans]|uniref:Putative secreted protein (Por secretion system target) n=1 Tax=Natronoflexus pectinivorans TaxID=682526 RepID=A0A4R2GKK3_9BACT|nr:fasciclin domain-containing protein [Natronoflexus pectinivorans]TCO09383.1 putative secreted protein (Por secretion system target) [Natronoflexus pectinivorans]
MKHLNNFFKKGILKLSGIVLAFFVSFQMTHAELPATVVDIITGSEVHETLATAVTAAGLVETLQGEGPFTVFAPTDAAFAALPDGLLDDLLADPEGALTNILLYHVAGGKVFSDDLSDGMIVTTVQGQRATITINDDGVFINDAHVVLADLEADNGVVHVIDAVITPGPATVVDIVVGSDVHTTLATAVTAAGLVETLQGEGPFTVFAPTDAAFAALPDGLLDDLLADPEGALTNILLYHVAGGKVFSDDLSDGMIVTTVQGQRATITINDDGVFINDAQVVLANLEADNGVVHVIDAVITPGPATVVDIVVGSDVHTTLATAVTAAGLVETLQGEGPFTVFAPTDAAFAALPDGLLDDLLADPEGALTNILLYHVAGGKVFSDDLSDGMIVTTVQGQRATITINDDGVFINDAQVVLANLEADNGVVHVIDAVITPGPATVVDIVVGSDLHTTLATAVTAAGLVETLQGEGPFTVFAPTDAAFAALPDGLLDDLLADPEGALTNILLYHVAGGKVFSDDLSDGMIVTTVQGQRATITINDDGVFINDAQVVLANLEADNGVVHVIDAVITPGPATVVDIVVGSDVHTTLATAVSAAGLVETLQGEGPFTVFAPTDAAFAALPDGLLDDLLADPEGVLTNILLYHVAGGKVFSDDLSDGMIVTTVQGQRATITINDDGVFINDAHVVLADLEADNGVVHVIDAVITPGPATVVDIVVGSDVHTTLATAVTAAGLVETLQGEGPFTVFAPTDAAFAALPDGLLDDLLADPEGALTNILLYHVAGGKVFSDDLSDGMIVTTVQGQRATITINDDGVFINDAHVVLADLEADNGVVHVIDAVITPGPATVVDIVVGSDVHTTLATAVSAAGLVETLQGEGPFTVFAPTDAAFAALPDGLLDDLLADPSGALTDILLYHVVGAKAFSTDLSDGQEIETLLADGKVTVTINEGGVFINDAQVIIADLEADNGVVHVIDAVLVPEAEELPATVVDIIVGSDVHTTLATAVTAAGLVETLQGEGPFTVFAPTDAAFAALPDGLLDDLLADPSGTLTDILLYHVVGAKAFSTDLSDGQEIETLLADGKVTVIINEDGVFINGAEVILANLEAQNGVVHVIDAVLVPETDTSIGNVYVGDLRASVFPNPARGQVNIQFELTSAGTVSLELFNVTGQRVGGRTIGNLPSGYNTITESVTDLIPGIYFVVIKSGQQQSVSKIQVVR